MAFRLAPERIERTALLVHNKCMAHATLTTLTIRLELSLKRAFEQAAAAQDRTVSQLLRDYMRTYVRDRSRRNAAVMERRKALPPFDVPRTPGRPL